MTTNAGWDFTSICVWDLAVLLFSLFPGSTMPQVQREAQEDAAHLSLSGSLEMANANLSVCVPSPCP